MMNTKRLACRWPVTLGVSLLLASQAWAEDPFGDTLTGDWGGTRTDLLDKGVLVEAANTTDYFVSAKGGVADDNALANLFELAMTADMEALAGIRGGTLFFLGLGTHGEDPGGSSGTIHAPSNLAADDAWRLLEFWYEQSFWQNRFGILAGLYAVDSEFDAKETAGVFLNGGFGTGLDLSETGINGPSVYPVTGLALRARYQFTPDFGVRAALTDGVPGDPDDSTAFEYELDDGGGSFLIAEADWQPAGFEFLRLGLGAWRYTTQFDRQDGNGTKDGTDGFYGFIEGVLYSEAGTDDQGLSGFIRVGRADETVNQFGSYQGAGLVYTGLLPGRDSDVLGLGVSSVVNGDDFVNLANSEGGSVNSRETVVELTYWVDALPWLSVQPSLQYTINPDTDPDIDNYLAVAVRLGITF
jgi:porin